MGIAPIPRVGGTSLTSAQLAEPEIVPPVALEHCDRMQEDAYEGQRDSANRGMEPEDQDFADDANADEGPSIPGDSHGRVDFLA